MFNRLMISILLLTATVAMSFQTPENQVSTSSISPKSGNTLTVTNAGPGTAVMTWSFTQPSLSYEYIIEDLAHHQVVKRGQTSQNSFTATGLAPGTYRFSVSNESIIIDDDAVIS